jgi:hypothetical protein
MFRTIFIFFSLTCSMIQCIPLALHVNPRNLLFRYATKQIQRPEGEGCIVYLWRAALTNRRRPAPRMRYTSREGHKMGWRRR